METPYNPWAAPIFPNTGGAFGVGSPAETAERQPTIVDNILSHIAGALGRGFMAPGQALQSTDRFADFRGATDIEDRRLENHHRPMSWHPDLPRDEVRWTPMAHQLGLTDIENQITDNDARLATSRLAEALGRLDIAPPYLGRAAY